MTRPHTNDKLPSPSALFDGNSSSTSIINDLRTDKLEDGPWRVCAWQLQGSKGAGSRESVATDAVGTECKKKKKEKETTRKRKRSLLIRKWGGEDTVELEQV